MKKIASGLVLALLLALSGCSEKGILFSKNFTGTGEIATHTISLSSSSLIRDFTLEIGTILFGVDDDFRGETAKMTLNIYDYGEPSVKITTNDNIFENLRYKRTRDSFVLEENLENKYVTTSFIIDVYGVSVSSLSVEGTTELNKTSIYAFEKKAKLRFSGDNVADLNASNIEDLTLETSGSSVVTLHNVALKTLKTTSSGMTAIAIEQGTIDRYEDKASGSYVLNSPQTEMKECYVNASGAAVYEIAVVDILDIKSTGSIKARYRGHPSLSTAIAGANDVSGIDE